MEEKENKKKTVPWFNDEYIVVNGHKLVYSYRNNKIFVHPFGINKEPVLLEKIQAHNKIIMPKRLKTMENNKMPLPKEKRILSNDQSF